MTADIQLTQRLELCESKIRAGLSTFVEVGNALMEIRDGKLYRETHATFEAYCKEKWNMTRQYANNLISASGVVDNLETTVSKPTHETQVRPLAHLPPEQQKEVWHKALEIGGGKPTAKDVKRAVDESKPVEKEKPEPARRGYYKDWVKFSETGAEMDLAINVLESLTVDSANQIPARDLVSALIKRLQKVINNI